MAQQSQNQDVDMIHGMMDQIRDRLVAGGADEHVAQLLKLLWIQKYEKRIEMESDMPDGCKEPPVEGPKVEIVESEDSHKVSTPNLKIEGQGHQKLGFDSKSKKKAIKIGGQLDGASDTSDSDDETDLDDLSSFPTEDEDGENDSDNDECNPPLNSNDDDSGGEDEDLFSENTIVCYMHRVRRRGNTWKLLLRDGVMHINNRDLVFDVAEGEADF